MKPLLIAFALLIAHPAYAQLAPHNEAGVTFGHVHLSVADPKVHHQMWVEQFGGVVSTALRHVYRREAAEHDDRVPGHEADRWHRDDRAEPLRLESAEHGNAIAKWKAAGYEVQREFKGSEGFPNAFLIGPDGLRFELQEDTTLKVPASHIICTSWCRSQRS